MRRTALFSLLTVLIASCARAEPACRDTTFEGARYAVCEFDGWADIRVFLNDASGAPYGDFDTLKAALEAKGERLLFAMNGGMYRHDRSPVGLYVENGETLRRINTAECAGNFCLKPNGVLFVDERHAARETEVAATDAYLALPGDRAISFATQSGPMLVIDGAVHPKFNPGSESKKYRNGVGVRDRETVVFAIADTPVTLHAFATFFRDELKTQNALYLDGSISRLYAPELDRNDDGARMGPIVGVVAEPDAKGAP